MNQRKPMTRSVRLTESAIMLAFATVLSIVKILDLPYGGSITACSMLPVLIIAYRHGTGWGLFTALAFGLLQLLLGANNLSYATGAFAAVMIVLFDYIIAFGVLGLGGLFRKIKDPSTGLALAALVTARCAISATSSPAMRYGGTFRSPRRTPGCIPSATTVPT